MRDYQAVNNIVLFVILTIFVLFFYVIISGDYSISISALSLSSFFTIFLSLFLEAIPFMLAGVLISGFIQVFVSEEHIRRLVPKNRFYAIVTSCTLGALFPACECGIVPIIRRLLLKGIPLYAAIGFMLTGPLINPLVLFSTYMAFGQEYQMAILRLSIGFLAAIVISFIISFLFKANELKISRDNFIQPSSNMKKPPFWKRIGAMFHHSINEFFQMSKFFIIGALLAAFVQTYVSSSTFVRFGEDILSMTLVMMVLAYILSLCSEADAFIAASFRQFVPTTSLLAFLVYGPMIDLKNTFMLGAVFKFRFVVILLFVITGVVLVFSLLYNYLVVGGIL